MAFRKRTLRSMLPTTRKVARLIGEQESIARRFKNLIPELQRMELDSIALNNSMKGSTRGSQGEPEDLPDILTHESTGIPQPKV